MHHFLLQSTSCSLAKSMRTYCRATSAARRLCAEWLASCNQPWIGRPGARAYALFAAMSLCSDTFVSTLFHLFFPSIFPSHFIFLFLPQ